MQTPVIHFTSLNDLLAEFTAEGRQIVRVATLQRRESKGGQLPRGQITISVCVRALHRGTILSYQAMHEEIYHTLISDREQVNQEYKKAWDDADQVRVAICIAIRGAGHDVRPGIIDLGDVQPILGEQWPLSEADHA